MKVFYDGFRLVVDTSALYEWKEIKEILSQDIEVDFLSILKTSGLSCNLRPKKLKIKKCSDLDLPNLGNTEELLISKSKIDQKMWAQLKKIPYKHCVGVFETLGEYCRQFQRVTFLCDKIAYDSKIVCDNVPTIGIDVRKNLSEEALAAVVLGIKYNPGKILIVLTNDYDKAKTVLEFLLVFAVSLKEFRLLTPKNFKINGNVLKMLAKIDCEIMAIPNVRLCPRILLENGGFKKLVIESAFGGYKKNNNIELITSR